MVSVWDLDSRRVVHTFAIEGLLRTVQSFSPDAKLGVVVDGATAKVYDAANGSLVGPAIQHENYRIDDVAFTADSKALLIAGAGYARAWDVRRGVPLTPLLTHGPERDVTGVATSPDGRFFATISSKGTARVWDAQTSLPLTPALEHGEGLQDVAFSRDGSLFVTAGDDYARVWSLTADVSMSDEDLALYAKVLAARQIDATRGVASLDLAQFRDAWNAYQARAVSRTP
jgi:WD40 repeat protein